MISHYHNHHYIQIHPACLKRQKCGLGKKEDEDKTTIEKDKPLYIPYLPSYLSTPNKNGEATVVTPSTIRKQSRKRVSISKNVEYIHDEAAAKTGSKKERTHSRSSPSHKTGPSTKDKAWKYDDNNVPYCSDS